MERKLINLLLTALICYILLMYNTILLNSSKFHQCPLRSYQTYSAINGDLIHYWEEKIFPQEEKLVIQKLFSPSRGGPHTGFLFLKEGKLRLADLVDNTQWLMNESGNFELDEAVFFQSTPITFEPFQANGFTFKSNLGEVIACDDERGCKAMKINPQTVNFAFAEANGNVLATTNWGECLLFRQGEWCRMKSQEADKYRCVENAEVLVEPTGKQFYSSIVFQGETLIGEYPSGRIYVFDGEILKPWDIQPPFLYDGTDYEAQSMAVYCGDLYVGYWPTAEIWKMDGRSKKWSLVSQLISNHSYSSRYPNVPYSDRPEDGKPYNFYGRRITALVPYGDSLYASTANKNSWHRDHNPEFMSKEKQDEYGAVYRIKSNRNCETR